MNPPTPRSIVRTTDESGRHRYRPATEELVDARPLHESEGREVVAADPRPAESPVEDVVGITDPRAHRGGIRVLFDRR